MSESAVVQEVVAEPIGASSKPNLSHAMHPSSKYIFIALLVYGLIYTGFHVFSDIESSVAVHTPIMAYVLLGVALLIALGFEFVNGFHDTANAVATVIYTHSLPPQFAVIWSGFFNFIGVLVSSGAVAFGIISLLPVELILQVGSSAGFAMVFALLIAAILWNLGTWLLGLPASSSHTMIGSIIGVGVANALMHGRDGTSGVDWSQATKVGYALFFSPLIGFVLAALVFWVLRQWVKSSEMFNEPQSGEPPPWWVRALLVLTCTGVSFAHGSNDGQKGMGLIMLILVGTAPLSYALNRSMPVDQVSEFVAVAQVTRQSLVADGNTLVIQEPRQVLTDYIRTHQFTAETLPAVAGLTEIVATQVKKHNPLGEMPQDAVPNVRNDMYLLSESIRVMDKDLSVSLRTEVKENLRTFKKRLDSATKFIPLWVKVAVAIALGLGTMIGWKRIVVTVGEKIGKTHLSYAQGASAELVAMATIGAADAFGLPVSTTHVLSSGVAGSMAANSSGLQWTTLRNMLMAWVLTLPVAMMLSGSLFWLFSQLF